MKEISLTKGRVTLVDDEFYQILNQYKWCAQEIGDHCYARKKVTFEDGSKIVISMHTVIMGKPKKGYLIDHINGDGLDNRRHNLRFVTYRQNGQNIKRHKKTSKYPGVYKHASGKWQAYIRIKGVTKYLGTYINELDAYRAYENGVKEINETVVGY